ncbi:MAG: HAMP domain-containing histidine kinase [Cyclobacteriaceae bacterium]|nr:HAMP domain-containing histidine kinase [Cyclobacteriaceae bacterium]MCH8516846.1 HAMP domain-containing histidine kinase [Cyclobacteriaceae bacterium]
MQKLKESLLKSEDLYVVHLDQEGFFAQINIKYRDAFIGVRSFRNLSIFSLMYEKDRDIFKEKLQLSVLRPNRYHHWQIQLNAILPNLGDLHWYLKAEVDSLGNHLGFVCYGFEPEKLLQHYCQSKEETISCKQENDHFRNILNILNHDFRGPLASMAGLVQLMEYKTENQEIMDLVVQQMNALQDKITELNRQIDDEGTLFAEFHLSDLVKNVICEMKAFTRPSEEYDIILKGDVKRLKTNRVYLKSILYNLISNAIKYRHPNRNCKIQVKLLTFETCYHIEVEDNGLGINLEEHGNKLFEPYATFHEHPDAKGLGLHNIKNQIESLGGHIEVRSEFGQWTRFVVCLPYDKSEKVDIEGLIERLEKTKRNG